MNNQINPNVNNSQQPMGQAQPMMQQASPMQPVSSQPNQVVQKTNTMCVLALVFAFLIPLIGFILGIIGIGNSKKKGEKGKGMAIAAIIISLLMPVVIVILFFGVIVGLINGGGEASTALQEACDSLDIEGNYESRDGFVVCENFYCEYEKDGFTLSSTCNLIDNNNDQDEEDEEEDEAPVVEQPKDKLAKLCQTYASSVSEQTFYHNGRLYSGNEQVDMSLIFDENGLFKQGEICVETNGYPTCVLIDEEKNNHSYICTTNQYAVTTYNEVMSNLLISKGCSQVDNIGNYVDAQTGLTCTNYMCSVTLDGKAYSKSCK